MNLMRQVWADLRREIGSVIFYSVMTVPVVMAFVLIHLSYRDAAAQDRAVRTMTDHNAVVIQLKSLPFHVKRNLDFGRAGAEQKEELENFCRALFAKEGSAGTFLVLPGRGGYQQVILLLGKYAEWTPFEWTSGEPVVFAASYDRSEGQCGTFRVGTDEVLLHSAPPDMEIYHPLFYLNAASGMLEDTLFLFSHDWDAVQCVLKDLGYEKFQTDTYFERLILESDAKQEVLQLRTLAAECWGSYVSAETIETFLKTTVLSGMRTHRLYLLFYLTAFILLFAAMFFHIYRILRKKIAEYAVYHLFGVPGPVLFARMFLLGASYQILPSLGVAFLMKRNGMEILRNLIPFLAGAGLLLGVLTCMVYRELQRYILDGRKGE